MLLDKISKWRRLGVRLLRNNLVRNVDRSILVLASYVRTNFLVLGGSGTKIDIILMLRGKRRLDIHVVLVILQRKTAYILFILGVRKEHLPTWLPVIITFNVYVLLYTGTT